MHRLELRPLATSISPSLHSFHSLLGVGASEFAQSLPPSLPILFLRLTQFSLAGYSCLGNSSQLPSLSFSPSFLPFPSRSPVLPLVIYAWLRRRPSLSERERERARRQPRRKWHESIWRDGSERELGGASGFRERKREHSKGSEFSSFSLPASPSVSLQEIRSRLISVGSVSRRILDNPRQVPFSVVVFARVYFCSSPVEYPHYTFFLSSSPPSLPH